MPSRRSSSVTMNRMFGGPGPLALTDPPMPPVPARAIAAKTPNTAHANTSALRRSLDRSLPEGVPEPLGPGMSLPCIAGERLPRLQRPDTVFGALEKPSKRNARAHTNL